MKRLSKLFNPNFDHEGARIKIEHFSRTQSNPEIVKLIFDSSDSFYDIFIRLFIDGIVGDKGYGDKYIQGTLTEKEKEVLKRAISDSEVNLSLRSNVYGTIAETIFKSFRLVGGKDSFFDKKDIFSTATSAGPDLVELIVEGEDISELLMILRDSRSNTKSDISAALKEKIKKLSTTRWTPIPKRINELRDLPEDISSYIKDNILELNYEKVIAIISNSEDCSEIVRNESLVEKKIVELEGLLATKSDKERKKELERWKHIKKNSIYEYFYIVLVIPSYKEVCEKILIDIKPFL